MRGLAGEFSHKLDAKGRLTLPSAFRKYLIEQTPIYVVRWKDHLAVYTTEDYESYIESVFEAKGGFNPIDPDHVKLDRTLRSRAMDNTVDAAGRISIAKSQREKLGLSTDVTLVGTGDHFEIWDAKRWNDMQDDVDLESLLFG